MVQFNLMKKKVLFISPEAFGYYKSIIKSLTKKGSEVTWVNQIPSNNVLTKAFIRFFPNIGANIAKRHFRKSINWEGKFDYVFVIKGEGLSESNLKKMRCKFHQAKFIYFNWDSFRNSESALNKIKYFDRVVSFDLIDCENIKNVRHLPLFYTDDYRLSESNMTKDYIAVFIGTIHSNRYQIVESISRALEIETGLKSFKYYFFANKFIFNIFRCFKHEFRNVNPNKINFVPLNSVSISNKIKKSKIIIDISHSKQTGLTMRTIETIGMKCKLITNNQSVVNYDFYHKNNILIFDVNDINIPKSFIDAPYVDLPNKIYEKYHVDNWVNQVLDVRDM